MQFDAKLIIFRVLKFPKVRYYTKEVRWEIKAPFNGISKIIGIGQLLLKL